MVKDIINISTFNTITDYAAIVKKRIDILKSLKFERAQIIKE